MAFINPQTNLEKLIEIQLEAPQFDDSWTKIAWSLPSKNNTKECVDDREYFDGIHWFIKDQNSREIKFQLIFCDEVQASHFETIDLRVINTASLKSMEGVSLTGHLRIIKAIYLYVAEGQTQEIEKVANTVKAAAVTSGILSFVISKLLKAGMQ